MKPENYDERIKTPDDKLYKAHSDLVDKKFRGGLTPEESAELERIREAIEGPKIYQNIKEAFGESKKEGEK